MKKTILLFLLVTFFNYLSAQNLGLHIQPSILLPSQKGVIETNASFALGSGVSFEFDLLKRNKVEIGLSHQPINSTFDVLICSFGISDACPEKFILRYNYLEIPINIKTRLGKKDDKRNTYLVTGYAFNYYLNTRSKVDFYDGTSEISRERADDEPILNALNLGLEFERTIAERFSFFVTPSYYFRTSWPGDYVNNINSFRLGFRLAYSLKE